MCVFVREMRTVCESVLRKRENSDDDLRERGMV